jgi:hypothetical protein
MRDDWPIFLLPLKGVCSVVNAVPIIGWFLSILVSTSLSVPFWFFWTVCGIGEKYFYFLPPVWKSIPFFECIGLFIAVSIIQAVFVPKLVTVSQTTKSES